MTHAHRLGNVPDGLIHEEGAQCPFADRGFPVGTLEGCCSLRGKAAAYELEALGRLDLAEGMYSDMTCDEAIGFGEKLRVAADLLEAEHADDAEKPRGAPWNGTWNRMRCEMEWGSYSSFDEAIASIREAARWYEKVGAIGFGVHAWY